MSAAESQYAQEVGETGSASHSQRAFHLWGRLPKISEHPTRSSRRNGLEFAGRVRIPAGMADRIHLVLHVLSAGRGRVRKPAMLAALRLLDKGIWSKEQIGKMIAYRMGGNPQNITRGLRSLARRQKPPEKIGDFFRFPGLVICGYVKGCPGIKGATPCSLARARLPFPRLGQSPHRNEPHRSASQAEGARLSAAGEVRTQRRCFRRGGASLGQ